MTVRHFSSQLELIKKTQIVFIKQPDIVNTVLEHGYSFNTKSEGKTAVLLRIVAYHFKDFRGPVFCTFNSFHRFFFFDFVDFRGINIDVETTGKVASVRFGLNDNANMTITIPAMAMEMPRIAVSSSCTESPNTNGWIVANMAGCLGSIGIGLWGRARSSL